MRSSGLTALGLGAALEALALGGLAGARGPAPLLLVLHAAAAALLGGGLLRVLGRYRQADGPAALGLLCFVAVALYMPVVGPLGLLIIAPSLRRQARPAPVTTLAVLPPPLPARPPDGPPEPPGDALRGILWHGRDPERRSQALLRAAHLGGSGARVLLRIGLQDPDDDVRLLAQALLARREAQHSPGAAA